MLASIMGPQGSGKAQPFGSKVLTPNGWVNIEELKVGDTVTTPNNKHSKIVGVFPQGRKPIFNVITHDGATTKACSEHLWKIHTSRQTKRNNKPVYIKYEKVVSTTELQALLTKAKRRRSVGHGSNIGIPLNSALALNQFPDSLPFDPYVLGCLLGDGYLGSDNITMTSADDHIIDRMTHRLLPGYVLNRREDTITFGLSNANTYGKGISKAEHTNVYLEAIRELQLAGKTSDNKFIPDLFKLSSIENRIELIRGLIDTDGTVSRSGSNISYTTVSHQLAMDVQFIARSLGCTASVTSRRSRYRNKCKEYVSCKTAYTVHINHNDTRFLTTLPRKLDRIKGPHYTGHKNGPIVPTRRIVDLIPAGDAECVCIAIDDPDHLYVTDDFIVTHNSTILAEAIKRGHNVIERKTSRSILSDWNVSLDEINSTPTLTIKFQDEILKRKQEDEAEYLDDPDSLWFTERSYVDLFCYSAIMLGHYNEYSDWVNEYYERCAAAQKKYARVCYVQAGVFVPVHDGIRGTNIHYSRLADLFMSDYVTRMTDADKIVRVTAVSVEERVEAILAGL